MKSIKHVTYGLASSLFLNVGLTRLAEKADPMLKQNAAALTNSPDARSGSFSTFPCQFTVQAGQ